MRVGNFQNKHFAMETDSQNPIRVHNGRTYFLLENGFEKLKLILKIVLNIIGSILIVSYILPSALCMLKEDSERNRLISTMFAGAGISYIIIEILSPRLIYNGECRLGYILCVSLVLDQEQRKCPGAGDMYAMGQQARTHEWQSRLQVVQGALIFTCVTQVVISFLVLHAGIRRLARIITPITIAPTMLLISISVTKTSAMKMANTCWISFFVTAFLMLLSYYAYYYLFIKNNRTNNDKPLNLRQNLHIGVLCVSIVWILCILLSLMEYVDSESPVKTYVSSVISEYPLLSSTLPSLFQWKTAKYELDAVFLILPACFISIFEILISYYDHFESEYNSTNLQNVERVTYTWSSLIRWETTLWFFNSTTGTTLLGTSMKKRNQDHVGYFIGAILIFIAFSGKLCSLLLTIPESVACVLIFLGFISMFFEGLNVMQRINFKVKKNLYIVGCSLFLGIVIPALVRDKFSFVTGQPIIDNIILSLLSIEFIVGGFVAFFLDNVIPTFTSEEFLFPTDGRLRPVCHDDDQNKYVPISLCDCFLPLFV